MVRDDLSKQPAELEAERAYEQSKIDEGQLPLWTQMNSRLTQSQRLIAEPLNDEEEAEKDVLSKLGFGNWNKRDYQGFIRGCEMYGRRVFCPPSFCSLIAPLRSTIIPLSLLSLPQRSFLTYGVLRDAWELVQTEIVTKTVEEIQAYAAVFWDRKRELDGMLRVIIIAFIGLTTNNDG